MQSQSNATMYDPEKLSQNLLNAFIRYQNAMNHLVINGENNAELPKADPFNLSSVFSKAAQEIFSNPEKMVESSINLYMSYLNLWNKSIQKSLGQSVEDDASVAGVKDSRFKDSEWEENPYFNFIKNSYYLNSSWINNIIKQLHNLDKKEEHKLEFYTKQFLDAMSPTNFPLTNPSVLKETLSSNGENFAKGAEHFLEDVKRTNGHFSIATTDFGAFEIGKNLAVTPGKVVYQNDLMQLIQYAPTTEKVKKVPLIMMPAWINKYYILDLQPQNSFIKWVVGKGFTVFMISWNNPDQQFNDKSFEDYMNEGPLAAIKRVQEITGEKEINLLGYCLGGTLLSATTAYLTAQGKNPIKSATFLASLVDFEECGDLGVFIDEEQISSLEKRMSQTGYLDGHQMAQTFSMLRANDMIWSFYINNYLLGKEPFPFDILYWNADSTRLPANMHSYYLRNMYQNNLLVKKNALTLGGVKIDLTKIKIPIYMLSTREDHIAPWRATYQAVNIYSGHVRFALSASGHVAGVVNHPDKNKYSYWVSEIKDPNPEKWLEHAKNIPGSWWLDWEIWLNKQSGEKIAARQILNKHAIEEAPGSYVRKRIV